LETIWNCTPGGGDLEQTVRAGAAEQAPAPVSEPLEAEDFALLDISDAEIDIMMSDDPSATAAQTPGGGAKGAPVGLFNSDALPGPDLQTAELRVPVETAATARENSVDENLVIDLSDMDLENFLSDLEDSSEKGSGAGNGGAVSPPAKR